MRLAIASLVFALTSVSVAHAIASGTPVPPATYGGTLVVSSSYSIPNTEISYTDDVYADPNNPLCAGCFDFVVQVSTTSETQYVTGVSTTGFSGYELAYGYEAVSGDLPPSSESDNAGTVSFSLSLFDATSDPLIVFTNATDYAAGGLTVNSATLDPPSFGPAGPPYSPGSVTPEPSSFVLLGSGLLSVAGMIRRRRLA